MALIECLDVARVADERLWGCYLDYPTPGTVSEGAALEIRGWVLSRHASAIAVEICHQGRVIRRVPVDLRREDVARMFPSAHNAELSGFGTTVRIRPDEGQRLEVQAVLADQRRVPLGTLELRMRWREDQDGSSALVSVIIPCYRQAHYLHEAIESVLAQTYPHVETVVVDDGSPDNVGEVAGRYPRVRCVRQPNAGVSAARNLGIRSSNGSFLLFLDSDDRLLPHAIEAGLECFAQHPEVAFVSGRLRFIAADGATLYEMLGFGVEQDHYAAMLHRNYVVGLCAVLLRRSVFETVTGFSPVFSVCADYDLYLRVLREFPASTHDREVAEYRRHGLGMSVQVEEMLREALAALRAQRPHLAGNPSLVEAYRSGVRFWQGFAAETIARQVRADWQNGHRRAALRRLIRLRHCGLAGLAPVVWRGYTGVLGVERTASEQRPKNVNRTVALDYHPDRDPDDRQAEECFKEAAEAHGALAEGKRGRDDRLGHARVGSRMTFGVMLVRNEADIVRANLSYHLALGIDHVLVVDNGSTDGTLDILEELAATGRVHVFSRPGAFLQSAMTTDLAREAYLRGAEWVVPIDADEFWHVPNGRLRDVLDNATGTGVLEAEVVNFVQHRSQRDLVPGALLTMTRRVPRPVGTSGEADVLVESGRIGFVEICYPPKCVSRGSIAVQIAQGNHAASGTYGPSQPTTAVRCLHAPLRARAALEHRKLDPERPPEEISEYLRHTWQLRRWRRLAAEGALDAEWSANSYLNDDLDVYGEKHPVVIDTTLRDLVAPWIEAVAMDVPAGPHAGSGLHPPEQSIPDLDDAAAGTILDRMERIEGWFRREEGELLLRTARHAVAGRPTPAIVEVGSYCGKSTIVLASAAMTVNPAARVYAIDPHEGKVGALDTLDGVRSEPPTFERFKSNVAAAGVDDLIHPIRRRSYDVPWQLPIAFLMVDGLHDYENVARDFRHFEPYLSEDAYVALHDCDDAYPGVQAFVAGLAGDAAYEEVGRAASLVVFRRRARSPNAGGSADDQQVSALQVRVAQQEKGIAFLMGEIAARERTIREREEGIAWLRGVVRDKESGLAELEKGVEWLRKEVRERDRVIEALRASAGAARDHPET